MKIIKSKKRLIDNKTINVFLHALIIFGILVISGIGTQVLTQ